MDALNETSVAKLRWVGLIIEVERETQGGGRERCTHTRCLAFSALVVRFAVFCPPHNANRYLLHLCDALPSPDWPIVFALVLRDGDALKQGVRVCICVCVCARVFVRACVRVCVR